MSLQVSHYNMLRASHEGSQKVVVRTVITVRFVPGAAIAKSILYCAGQLVFKESGHHLTGTDTIYFVTVRLHMHNSTYSSIFCFSMSVLLSRRRVSGDLSIKERNTFYATPACGRKLLPNVYPCQQALLSEARQPARKTI